MASIFAQVAPGLIAHGYSPLPIVPNSKAPGTDLPMKNWHVWCHKVPPPNVIAGWSRYPDCGVGVACGMGLICVDIDFEPAMDALLAILPMSHVQKKGKKGVSLFYRGNTDVIRSRNFRTPEKVGLVDLLGEGKQTVLPPSIHPDTGEPYYWWTDDTLMDLRLEDLTELPDDIADRIGEVLKQFGYDPNAERRISVQSEAPRCNAATQTAFSIYRQANDNAMANLDCWVPKLYLYKHRRKAGGFEAVATWRQSCSGRPRELRKRNLSIDRRGIKDFGTGETYTPVDLVMRALELDKSAALNWLLEQLPQDSLIILQK